MPSRFEVPMTRASGFGPLPQLVVAWEGERALTRAFETQGLSLAAAEQPGLYVPVAAMMGVFERAARDVGRRDFGLAVGERMDLSSHGLWLQYSTAAASLGQAFRRADATAHFHQSGARLVAEREGDFVIWRYHPPVVTVQNVQHADHLIHPMLRFVQIFLGKDWAPAWFELNYPRDSDSELIEARLPAPVRFGQKTIGLAIPAGCLSHKGPFRVSRPITLLDVEASEGLPNAKEPLRSIIAIAILRLMDGKTDIEGTAGLAGMGVRTLQRVLNTEGLSHRESSGLGAHGARHGPLTREQPDHHASGVDAGLFRARKFLPGLQPLARLFARRLPGAGAPRG